MCVGQRIADMILLSKIIKNNPGLQETLAYQRRSIPLSLDQIRKFISRNFKIANEFAKKGKFLYRGMKYAADKDYYYINPKEKTRIADQQSRFAHFLFDILPSWKNWPKRSKSVIFTNSLADVGFYGNTYVIFPDDGVEIAICPSNDFWFDWSYLNSRWSAPLEGLYGIPMFNTLTEGFFKNVYDTNDLRFSSLSEVEEVLYKINQQSLSLDEIIEKLLDAQGVVKIEYLHTPFMKIIKDMKENFEGDWLKYFDGLLNPESNQFKLIDINEAFQLPPAREMFTDSVCLLIKKGAAFETMY